MDARIAAFCLLLHVAPAVAFDHSAWDRLLRRHVVVLDGGRASQVHYAAIDRAELKRYLAALSSTSMADFGRWPRERYFAPYAALLAPDAQGRSAIAAGKARIAFLEYDWALNDFRSSSPR